MDLDPLQTLLKNNEVVKLFFQKCSNAIGILYEPHGIKRKAKAESKAYLSKIDALVKAEELLAQSTLSEFELMAVRSQLFVSLKRTENIEKILFKAAEQLEHDADPESIDDDWISHFFKKSESIASEDMQQIWASILAGEANSPGTFSRKTLNIVESFERRDAQLFTDLCQFTILMGKPTPVINSLMNPIYNDSGVNYESMWHLEFLGLVNVLETDFVRTGFNTKYGKIDYFGQELVVEFKNEKNNSMKTGHVAFTKAGEELWSIAGGERNEEFFQFLIKHFDAIGIKPRFDLKSRN